MLVVAAVILTIGIGANTLGRIFNSKYLYEKGMSISAVGLILGFIAVMFQ